MMKKEYSKSNSSGAFFSRKHIVSLLCFLLLSTGVVNAQTRSGAIDLTAGEGRYIACYNWTGDHPLGSSAFTIEMWVKIVDNSGNDFCFFNMKSCDNRVSFDYANDQLLRVNADGPAIASNGDVGGAEWNLEFTSSDVFLNNWVHVAIAYNGEARIRYYINGVRKYSTNLYYSGNKLTKLMPQECTGGYLEIGAKDRSGFCGKGYIADIRIWNKEISSTNIGKYYNEEINSSHPDWNNLIRYYTGSEQYTIDGKAYYPDRTNHFDAISENYDIRVVDKYPPIHPPRLRGTTVNFAASDCQTSTIAVTWNDFRNSGSYYNYDRPGYSLQRKIGSGSYTTIRENTERNYNDIDINEETEIAYKLYSYWDINGARYYSNDYTETTGSWAKSYDAPTNVTATDDNCNGTISIDWSSTETPPLWYIERATNSLFTTAKTTIKSNLSGSTTNYTDNPPLIETNYYYRVKAFGTDNAGCSVVAATSVVADGYSADMPQAPASLVVTPDSPNELVKIDWTQPANNNADSWIVKRTLENGTEEVTISNLPGYTYTDSTIEQCVVYKYTVGAVNGCSTGEYFEEKTASISYSELDDKIADLEVSKGYYSDRVQLEWEIKGTSSIIENFILQRSPAGEFAYKNIATLESDFLYNDYTALGSTMYDYRIQAAANCLGTTVYSNDITETGFRIPFGVANGHIEYEGGNAVEDVKVGFERKDGQPVSSLYFDGDGAYVDLPDMDSLVLINGEITIEIWVKYGAFNNYSRIIDIGNGSANNNILLANRSDSNSLCFHVYDGNTKYPLDIDNVFKTDEWMHIAATIDNTGYGTFYVNGDSVDSKMMTPVPAIERKNNYIGKSNWSADSYFEGNIDEVRIWNVARTAGEIEDNYNRILNGDEEGLIAYYRMDEGVGNAVYDASHSGENYNKNDGAFVGDVSWSNDGPTADQLGIFTKTDIVGDYSLEYIPYTGSGEIFKVTPSLGQHQFSPGSRSLFVGDGQLSNNGVDFTDISSFSVSGKVTYENSTYPVEGVTILIDGSQAMSADNSIVHTDENGEFEIDVPIGTHYISTEKDGHTFSEGYFPPLNEYGEIEKYEFTDDITGLEFTDNSKVKVVGRVVGGTREGNKEPGFGLSTNNIGVADIKFESTPKNIKSNIVK